MEKIRSVNLAERLEKYPHVKERFEALVNLIENESEDCRTADQIEEKLIKEVRLLANTWLTEWAEQQEQKQQAITALQKDFIAKKHDKKKLHGEQLLAK